MKSIAYYREFKEKGVCIVVPTYNNERTLPLVLTDILEYTDQIIVVNDGSTDTTPQVLLEFPGLKIFSYSENQGKGYALRKGFQVAAESGYRYAITIDSDGQHFAEDLPKFLIAVEAHPSSIVIGSRNMDQSSVPGKSSFGNRFSNFWFWVETGLRMKDTQSGYRLYPLKPLQEISFLTKKFEFEIEVLVRSAWNDVMITDVPVRVFYAEPGKRVSHFRPFRDFTRISILNTVLVIIALLYIKPRDFFSSFKKKNSKKFPTSFCLTLPNPITLRHFQLDLEYSWA